MQREVFHSNASYKSSQDKLRLSIILKTKLYGPNNILFLYRIDRKNNTIHQNLNTINKKKMKIVNGGSNHDSLFTRSPFYINCVQGQAISKQFNVQYMTLKLKAITFCSSGRGWSLWWFSFQGRGLFWLVLIVNALCRNWHQHPRYELCKHLVTPLNTYRRYQSRCNENNSPL